MTTVDEVIELLKKNDAQAGPKFGELNKNDVVKNFERIVLEGIIPCCQTGYGNMVFTNVQTVAQKINDLVPPRTLAKDPALFEKLIDATLVSFTPAPNVVAIMSADVIIGINATYMMQVVTKIAKEKEVAELVLPKLMQKLKSSTDSTLRSTFLSPVVQLAMTAPQSIAPYNDYFVTLIENKDPMWSLIASALAQSISLNPTPAIDSFESFIDLVDESAISFSSIGGLLEKLAEIKPSLFAGDMLKVMQAHENNQMAVHYCWSIYGKVAKDPECKKQLMPVLDRIEASPSSYLNYGTFQLIANLLVDTEAGVVRGLKILHQMFGLLATTQPAYQGVVVSQMKTLATAPGIPKTVIDPYMDDLKKWSTSTDQGVQNMSKAIVNYREGKDLESVNAKVDQVETKVEEQGKKIETVQKDVQEVKVVADKLEDALKEIQDIREYIDSRINEVKDFLAEVVKKLPLPIAFSDEGLIIKKITLYFECSAKCSGSCLYPGPDKGKRFKTETKEIHKWLKVAFSAIQLGKAIWEQNPVDGLSAIKNAYDAVMTKYDKNFKAFCSEPFLTSTEQDNLIEQLRDANFFQTFTYDPQTAGWECSRCNLQKKEEKQSKAQAKGQEVPSSPQLSASPVSLSAKLQHRTKLLKRWTEHEWTLSGDVITYVDGKKPKEAAKIVDVLNVVHTPKEKHYRENVFTVTVKDKDPYELQAASETEAKAWVDGILNNVRLATKK